MTSDIAAQDDPYLWLEEVLGERALTWVEEQNTKSTVALTKSDEFIKLRDRLRTILDSDDRIPHVTKFGDWYYNFWQDANNPKGLLRRTTLDEYRKPSPNWETVLDIDALAVSENENWVYQGSLTYRPTNDRTLLRLSRGGADAVVIREFDLVTKEFVVDGFFIEEAKTDVDWFDRDQLLVATDFGEGTLTESGYAYIVKRWQRGTPLTDASVFYQGERTDVGASGFVTTRRGYERRGVFRALDFYNSEHFVLRDEELIQLDKPTHADVGFFKEWLLISPKEDWQVNAQIYPKGSLLASKFEPFLDGKKELDVLFEPTASRSLDGYSSTRDHLLLNVLENVRNSIEILTPTEEGWHHDVLAESRGFQSISAYGVDILDNNQFWIESSDFVTPTTLSLSEYGKPVEQIKQEPSVFNASGLQIQQYWATSKDGTKIPYFQVAATEVDAPKPTVLYGYGGFEIALKPSYQKLTGAAWLEAGGVYVVANIRGGGEFGPAWHRAALKENRHKAFEDFIAVAEHLVEREVTKPELLGTMGGSNGGLLMGNMLTLRPDLFGAIVASVPLFDMQRYNKLLAGASWVAEYGDPDVPEEWEFIQTFSPYHNLAKDVAYPPLFVTTSTRDDRVHPGHARKLVARMLEYGKSPLYYENTEGGHAGAADNEQRAHMYALQYQFLWKALND